MNSNYRLLLYNATLATFLHYWPLWKKNGKFINFSLVLETTCYCTCKRRFDLRSVIYQLKILRWPLHFLGVISSMAGVLTSTGWPICFHSLLLVLKPREVSETHRQPCTLTKQNCNEQIIKIFSQNGNKWKKS